MFFEGFLSWNSRENKKYWKMIPKNINLWKLSTVCKCWVTLISFECSPLLNYSTTGLIHAIALSTKTSMCIHANMFLVFLNSTFPPSDPQQLQWLGPFPVRNNLERPKQRTQGGVGILTSYASIAVLEVWSPFYGSNYVYAGRQISHQSMIPKKGIKPRLVLDLPIRVWDSCHPWYPVMILTYLARYFTGFSPDSCSSSIQNWRPHLSLSYFIYLSNLL